MYLRVLSGRSSLAAALLIAALLVGCAAPQAPAPSQPAARQLPSVLSLLDHPVVVSPPPPVGSDQLTLEMAELRALRSSLSDEQRQAIASWDGGAIGRWNDTARKLVAAAQSDPLTASRVYMVLSVAQYETLRAVAAEQQKFGRHMPDPQQSGLTPLVTDDTPSYPSSHAALAAASAAVLASFFPLAAPDLSRQQVEHQDSRLWAGVNCRSDILAGDALGREVAAQLVKRFGSDLQIQGWDGSIPEGPGKWVVDTKKPDLPLAPRWGTLAPTLMARPDQFRAPPPPAWASPEFNAALAEVRRISDTRTDEQLRIAKFWGDNQGTATPPGHWNQIAVDLIKEYKRSDMEAARTLAYLNMALYDAGIAAWDTKYTYWVIRPFNADPQVKTPVGRPSHPSYPSGHSAFSAAAATLLGAVFPEKRAELLEMAHEASLSRVYAGIHYRFDGDAGLVIGEQIGQLAADRRAADMAR